MDLDVFIDWVQAMEWIFEYKDAQDDKVKLVVIKLKKSISL